MLTCTMYVHWDTFFPHTGGGRGLVRLAQISQFVVLCLLFVPSMPLSFAFFGGFRLFEIFGPGT